MKIFVDMTVGCDLNYQPTYIMRELIKNFDTTLRIEDADIIVFPGSCVCSLAAALKTKKHIEQVLAKKKPDAITFLTGCMAREFTVPETEPIKKWINENFDFVVPQIEPDLLLKIISPEKYGDRTDYVEGRFLSRDGKARIYISNGCKNNCSFCKTTYQNLPLKSLDLKILKAMIDYYDSNGFTKLCLLGTNLCQYGLDTTGEYLLPQVIEHVEKAKNISSLELIGFAFKDAIKADFVSTLAKSSKIKTLDGGLESGSNRLLKLINKGFTTEELIEFVEKIDKEKLLILNLIAGFPTENKEDIKATLETIKRLLRYIDFISIIRYMDSPFVASHKYPQLENEEIQEHAEIYLKELSRYGIYCDGIHGTLLKQKQNL